MATSRAVSTSGLQILKFTPDCVQASPMIDAFAEALAEGRLAEWVAETPTWWAGVAARPDWLALFERLPAFRRWQKQFPQPTEQ